MKTSTLNTLLVAKSIYTETKGLVNSGDKHFCTAGIILLQDFVELVVLAALDELDVDEERSLESKPFDELLGELKKQGIKIIKSGTIKALNKQRVISKHYGQLTEVVSTVNYFNVAEAFVDDLLTKVTGKRLQEIFMTDLLKEGPVKETVKAAIGLADQGNYFDALVELRKAFFMAYEKDYSIYSWRNHDKDQSPPVGLLGLALRGGTKAHYWKRNRQWIDEHVKEPTDYVQIDYDQLKIDCMEWGLSTVHVENFRRLTPEVVETEKNNWHRSYDTNLVANESNIENFRYCLDLLLDFLLKEQDFDSRKKWPKREKSIPAPPIYVDKPLYKKPSQASEITHTVQADYFYSVDKVVTGFDCSERYLYVHLYQEVEGKRQNHIWGYLLVDD
jgi:hypothetical protein